MKIVFHKNFGKKLRKSPKNIKDEFKESVAIFLKDPYNPTLNNHSLKGKYKSFRSINVTADIRALYKHLKDGVFVFVDIDNHNNLYK